MTTQTQLTSTTQSKSKWSFSPFWKKTSTKTPGGAKPTIHVRGAQHPPLYFPTNDLKNIKNENKTKRNSVTLTLEASKFNGINNNKNQIKRSNYIKANTLSPNSSYSNTTSNISNNKFNEGYNPIRTQSNSIITPTTPFSPSLSQKNNNKNNNKNSNNNNNNNNKNNNKNSNNKINNNKNIINNKNKKENKNNLTNIGWEEIKTEEQRRLKTEINRRNTLRKLMSSSSLESTAFSNCCWRGIPSDIRPECWRLLLGYVPKNKSRRDVILSKKRNKYFDLVKLYYTNKKEEHRSNPENQIIHQIGLDVPRTSPSLKIFQIENIKKLLTRALFIWSHHHTATGYVQGINDLITPFVYVFLNELLYKKYGKSIESTNYDIISKLSDNDLKNVEADSYWCLDQFLESLQINYTHEQPGIQAMVERFQKVVEECDQENNYLYYQKNLKNNLKNNKNKNSKNIKNNNFKVMNNKKLSEHFKEEKLEFIQFSFRWMNCFLMREFSLKQIIRMWDTYLSEYHINMDNVVEFHIFVCVALLLTFKKELLTKDFAEAMLFIQDLPTNKWDELEISTLMSQAQLKKLQWSMSTRVNNTSNNRKNNLKNIKSLID